MLRIIILLLSEQFCFESQSYATDSKFEEIKAMFFKELKDPGVLFLTDTFCSSKIPDSFYNIPGYLLFRKDRLGKKGGRILAFVNDSIVVKRRPESWRY